MHGRSIDRVTLLNITFFVEAFVLLAATFWSYVTEIKLGAQLFPDRQAMLIGAACGLALAALSLILFRLGRAIKGLSNLREFVVEQVAPVFANLQWMDLIAVAIVSGFCEEILFRGVIQHNLGLFTASIIFGGCHCPSLKHISYAIWAFSAGLFLGFLYEYTHNLWAPILAHAVSNCVALFFLRYGIKPSEQAPEKSE